MSITHRWSRAAAAIASFALVGAGLSIAAPAAHADPVLSGPSSASPSQQVAFTLSEPPAGQLQLEDTTSQQVFASITDGFGSGPVTFSFITPTSAQVMNLNVWSVDNQSWVLANGVPLNVGGVVSTTTVVSAPNTAILGQSTTVNVTVTSNGGSQYTPPGQVRLTDANGAQYALMNLTKSSTAGQSFAYFRWTPKTAGTYYFIATYVPSTGSLATTSTSIQDAVIATPSGNTIAITAPPTLSVGTPVTLTATVYPSNVAGSVGFNVNGNWISASIPLKNGQASTSWTPTSAGQVTLGASYTTNSGGSGSTSEVVTVTAPTAQDVITLVQPGWGAWGNGGNYNMGNGSNFTFQASTLSGAPVALSETGPCAVSGLNLQVNAGSGTCTMKASTPGGNGYQATTYSYTINLVPGTQVATLSAPPSGRYKVGRVLVLESPGQEDTNAGQNITWKLKKAGKKHCQLLYPNNGSVTLRIKSKGTCTVIGKAPGVAGQWQAFQTARNYTGR